MTQPAFYVFVVAVLLVMFDSFHLQFMQHLPSVALSLLCMVVMVLYMSMSSMMFNFSRRNINSCLLFGVICLYQIVFCTGGSITSLLNHFTAFVCCAVVLLLKDAVKAEILRITSVTMGLILVASMLGWILYLLHVPMPHRTELEVLDFYTHTYYPTFTVNGFPYEYELPRFASVFMEPGHLATTCVFLLFANNMSLKQWYNILMFIAVIISFSLASWGLLIGGFIMHYMLYGKRRFLKLSLFVGFISLVTYISIQVNNSDNIVYRLIISRLEYTDSDDIIVGNNRFTDDFNLKFERFIRTSDAFFGIAYLPRYQQWWTDSSGWKRAVVMHGIIGMFFIMMFYYKIAKERRSMECMCLLLLWIVGNSIRDHVLKDFWLYIMIFAMPVLQSYTIQRKYCNV